MSVRDECSRRSRAHTRPRPSEQRPELDRLLVSLGSTPEHLPTLLEHIPLPAYVFDREARIRWFNAYARRRFGDLVGRHAFHHVAPEHLTRAREQFARKLVSGVSTAFDLVVLAADGVRIPLQISSVPVRRGHDVVGVFGVAVPAPTAEAEERDDFSLTARQHDVLRLLDEGLGTAELAARLGISVETARNHVRALLRELGVHSRLEAVAVARRYGLLPPSN
jgi:PAS domain S-box-containing protein